MKISLNKKFITSLFSSAKESVNNKNVAEKAAEEVKQVGHEFSANLMPKEVLRKAVMKEKTLADGTIEKYYNRKKVAEITPQGIERHYFNGSISMEYTPDKICKKFGYNGNYVEEPWEYINGQRMSLSEAKHAWAGDHLGHHTLNVNYLEQLEDFISKHPAS